MVARRPTLPLRPPRKPEPCNWSVRDRGGTRPSNPASGKRVRTPPPALIPVLSQAWSPGLLASAYIHESFRGSAGLERATALATSQPSRFRGACATTRSSSFKCTRHPRPQRGRLLREDTAPGVSIETRGSSRAAADRPCSWDERLCPAGSVEQPGLGPRELVIAESPCLAQSRQPLQFVHEATPRVASGVDGRGAGRFGWLTVRVVDHDRRPVGRSCPGRRGTGEAAAGDRAAQQIEMRLPSIESALPIGMAVGR